LVAWLGLGEERRERERRFAAAAIARVCER
jgi:hypothetical protein